MQDPECRLVGGGKVALGSYSSLQIPMKMEWDHAVVWVGSSLKDHVLKVSASGTDGMLWKP